MEKYTLITGGSEGLGLDLARSYAIRGNNLILISRSYEKLAKAREELDKYNVDIKLLSGDLSVEKSWEKIRAFVDKERLVVDRLINNVGIGSYGAFNTYTDELINDIISLNIKSLTKLTHIFLNRMLAQGGGEIMNVASTAAFSSGPLMSIYYATKAYVLNLTEALNEEYRNHNIKISCLCPGALSTEFQNKVGIKKKAGAEKLLMDTKIVAEIGIRGLEKGKVIIIPGFKNKCIIILNKFLPRFISRKVILKMNKE